MPNDNTATIAPGTNISFPNNGSTSNTSITRLSDSTFNLIEVGTYLILFQVSITEPGQLVLTLNDVELDYTVVGRTTGTTQLIEISLVTTTIANSTLAVRNPTNNTTALTITPLAGGTNPVTSNLTILQIR